MRLSIIIPHKDTPDLLRRCLDSIPLREGIEIIVVDNNSSILINTDQYPWLERTILVRDEKSIGPGGARNTGLDQAHGEWVIFADADDYFSEEFLDVLDNYFISNADVVYFNFHIRKKGESIPLPYSLRYLENYHSDNEKLVQMLRCRFPVPWNKMVRREFLQEHHITFKDCLVGEDGVFSFLVGYYAQSIIVDETKIYNYNLNPHSITGERIHNEDFYKCLFEQKFQYNEFFKQIHHQEWKQSIYKTLVATLLKKGLSQCLLATKILLSNRSYFQKEKRGIVDLIPFKKKLIRITTVDFALSDYMKGQNKFMNLFFEVIGVASDTGVLKEVARDEGIRMVNVPMKRQMAPVHDLWCLLRFYVLFRKERPYIVNSNSPKSSLLSMAAAKMAGVPNRIYTVSGLRYQTAKGLVRQILMNAERIACHTATIVIPEGNGVRRALEQDRITDKPMRLIHHGNINGVNTDYFCKNRVEIKGLKSQIGVGEDDFIFIFIGRIVKDKGIAELAQAMKRLSAGYQNVKLLLVGNWELMYGSITPECVTFLKESPHVVNVGFVKDVRPYLAISHVLVHPSYREGFPNVVLQAGAMELPSIVTDIEGSNEIIEDGCNGRIVSSHDADQLYQMMVWFLNHPTEMESMGIHARNKVERNFRQIDVWNAWKDFYLSL